MTSDAIIMQPVDTWYEYYIITLVTCKIDDTKDVEHLYKFRME